MNLIHRFNPYQWIIILSFLVMLGRSVVALVKQIRHKESPSGPLMAIGFTVVVAVIYYFSCF